MPQCGEYPMHRTETACAIQVKDQTGQIMQECHVQFVHTPDTNSKSNRDNVICDESMFISGNASLYWKLVLHCTKRARKVYKMWAHRF